MVRQRPEIYGKQASTKNACMHRTQASLAKTARIAQGLSLRDIAAVVGKSHMWVQLVESGHLAPTAEDLGRLSQALGIDLSEAIPTREGHAP